jgi:DNA polymerase III epsilon subunit-like protein
MDYDWILMRDLIFVDTETTGLDDNSDLLVELTWARLTGDAKTLYFGVVDAQVPDFIDDLIGFTKRGIAGKISPAEEIEEYVAASEGNTMVAANPAFDKGFLVKNHLFPFHYRMLDLESYAMAKLGLEEMPGMKTVFDVLTDMGHSITQPDHTSLNDVLAMRDAYNCLVTM